VKALGVLHLRSDTPKLGPQVAMSPHWSHALNNYSLTKYVEGVGLWGLVCLTAPLKGNVIMFLRLPLQRDSNNSTDHFWWSKLVIAFKLTVQVNTRNIPLCCSEAAEDHNHRNSVLFLYKQVHL